ncbi:related to alfa-L-rhamnosidase [Cephalotrichum gorgonifer]|uniref:alpha-L-rhamnosidase n=1 Tax=Cephalotrichum gorgonifer TaxID=2041049 RepID=A0AAE8MUQ3_9PEZI|nr:related to alfa-L-rhamnosidase [Cephalotrichum gorgonifer]
MAFRPVNLRFEHHLPLPGTLSTIGIGESHPRVSWNLENQPENFQQITYHLELLRGAEPTSATPPTYSEEIQGTSSTLIQWPESHALPSRSGAFVRVKVSGETASAWSDWHYVEAGLLIRSDWTCSRISSPSYTSPEAPSPSAIFKRSFAVKRGVKKARVYMTSQGVYDLRVNGKPVSTDFMNPGWTNYQDRLLYQVYDVAGALSEDSENHLTVEVAEGWFTGRLAWGDGVRNVYGDRNAIMAQLELEYADGTREVVNSDDRWQVTQGASTTAEIYDGQTFDASRAKLIEESLRGDLSLAGFAAAQVLPPLPESTELEAMTSAPMRQIDVLRPATQFTTPSGKTIIDFGQNLVGYARIKNVTGQKGHTITLKFAEVMENEELGTRPLRCAKVTDNFILAGTPEPESWEPNFTFHGFRYLQVDNWPGDTATLSSAIEAVVIHTDMTRAATFECSNASLNQLHSNVFWSMRGNFTGLPTDCPQRDERLGWTGDIAVFAPTATFLYDCTALLQSWLKDLWLDQKDLGGIPPVVSPNCLKAMGFWARVSECAIWNDAVILVPWALYQETGDLALLSAQFESMDTFLNSIPLDKNHDALWSDDSFQLGDWLDPLAPPDNPAQSQTDAHNVANAFLVNSLAIMAKICALLEKPAEAAKFSDWHARARQQFRHLYVTPAGFVSSDSQTAYALAIVFDLLEKDQLPTAGARLDRLIRKNGFRISTGFAGTPYVLEALVLTGHTQTAYRMLLETGCPSWLYPITMGATTTWERWDSMMPDGSINPGEMTSFNHYALGAVAHFLHERVGGLRCVAAGWARCRVEPLPGGEITKVKVEHLAIQGKIGAEWEVVDGVFRVEVRVPAGTVMEVAMPKGEVKEVGAGVWKFEEKFDAYSWPPKAISGLPDGITLEDVKNE